ncbi:MAG TPA: ROK family protein [Candidatus Ozemobacteraceae bacterium]|nr:ROK family protein [Candidatus Ozemobacteraceae bacterium]
MTTPRKQAHTIGIDLGGTKIAAGLCCDGTIVRQIIVPTHPERGTDAVIETMIDAARKAIGDMPLSGIAGIGIGAAGQIDPKTGAVIYAPNLNWKQVPLAASLSKTLGLPVRVTNDVRAATIAEWKYGAGKELDTFVNIFVGTGIGSGLVLNGKLAEGTTNSAGEIGHVCLDPDGPVCGCGKKGCFEAFSSGKGLENHVKSLFPALKGGPLVDLTEGDPEKITGRIIGQAAKAGDKTALEALKRVGRYLGLEIANVHTLLNPQIVLLGGGVMALRAYFMDELKAALHRHILPVADRGETLIGDAKFETDAVLIGASALF